MRFPTFGRNPAWAAILALGLFTFGAAPVAAAKAEIEQPRLYPQLSLSKTQIAFVHAGDIWVVPRGGGVARQVTAGPQDDSNPSFSQNGDRIAFSRTIGGDADVYVVPTAGGDSTRLTFHPAAELVRGWSPNGTDILFTAARTMSWQSRLYTVPANGGPTRELPIPLAWNGVFAPDGRIVFAPREVIGRYATSWPGYRGGSMGALELADLRLGTFMPLSSDQGNDRLPVWAGDRLLIASDRAGGAYNVFVLDLPSGQARPLTHFIGTGIVALAGAPDGAAAYTRDGRIFLLDPLTERSRPIPISLTVERGEMVRRQVPLVEHVDSVAINSSGDLAIAARGDVLFAQEGAAVRNLTMSSSATDQAPAFSTDGRQLAYVSFGIGGDRLVLEAPGDTRSRRIIALPAGRGGYFEPRWSPDGRHLMITDLRAGLWLVDLVSGTTRLLDRGIHMNDYSFEAAWSPDGQWLTYAKHLPNNNRAIFLQRAGAHSTYQLTSGEVDVGSPSFDHAGKELYFIASGNAAPAEAFGMYPAILRPLILRKIQAAAVDLSQPTALLEQSLGAAAFARRIRTLPFEARDYGAISLLADGAILASARQWPATPGSGDSTLALFRLSQSSVAAPIASDVDQFALSPDGSQLLVSSGDSWSVRPLPAGTGGKPVSLDKLRITVNPAEEWGQIYREAWRAMADTFYDPAHHGQNIAALEKRYARYLPGITRRADLTALLYLSLGNVSVSHIAIAGGDTGAAPPRPTSSGLLGADFTIDSGRFRFSKIYAGAPFDTESVTGSPLDTLDPAAKPGDYLLQVNGIDVTADQDVLFYLLGTAGRATTLTLAETRDGRRARTVTVTPLASDASLREAAWVEDNRAAVDSRSKGSLGYVYIPDFQERGIAAFLRQWTAASDKDGVVIDQRFNPGGWGTDFILDFVMHRPISAYMFRDALDLSFPVIGNAGPRALIVNERNGSASDTFPWSFQRSGLGPIVGHRTAGWGIGHLSTVNLMDGGELSLPLRGFFNPAGSWDIENHGVVPDVRVDQDPAASLRGDDAQLNAAIDAVLRLRREHPTAVPRHPAPIRYPPH